MSLLLGLLMFTAGVSLGGMEIAMGPDMNRFPCVNRVTIWIMRAATAAIMFCAFDVLWSVYVGVHVNVTPRGFAAWMGLALLFSAFLVNILQMRLDPGAWPLFQTRIARARKFMRLKGKAGPILARSAVSGPVVDPRAAGILVPEYVVSHDLPASFGPALEGLADQP